MFLKVKIELEFHTDLPAATAASGGKAPAAAAVPGSNVPAAVAAPSGSAPANTTVASTTAGSTPAATAAAPIKTDIKVLEIKQAIEEKEGIPPAQQRLIYGGVQMSDDKYAIRDYKIEGGSVLHLVLALRGGCAI
ncbi:hypothetical protein IWW37_005997 [Coemansia sp. RSA 2050]|nr:hypothetical protein IWW37_005997 [Coemansia sp. RSA 2050]KAJ2728382.1 hypothetical protein IW152_005993 [Coemansia sp. BCRC 34962]